ncbi:MAG TPA: Yip1 family protein [Pyrinomonadaceae bacterium]|nr:YIP1 family protein [Chloracidobacterium sp.]HBE81258.1 hypothetical protein [Blastocatellia bacterium]HRJ87601.1 Yip1 family protein [Pyrinomonadaceae bacterium]HRK50558.1 Yip1 family protein [Pyrinomonadaceae bacterium]
MEAENQAEWEAPPPPEKIVVETHEMSEIATLGNIFLEPGRTFEDLRKKPRFVLATVIISLLVTGFAFGLYYKVGDAGMRRFMTEQIDKSPQSGSMSPEQKSNMVDMNMTIGSVVRYVMPLLVVISMLVGGLFYWLGAKAFGGTGGFLHGLSTWVYASLPPSVVGMIANFIVLFFKSPDDIDIAASQRGVVNANPSVLFGSDASPVLVTLISAFDIFLIWGWVLAAIGLRITNKISSGSAWAITLIFALIGITFRVIGAFFSGNPS